MRILLIDDEELSRKALYEFLSSHLGHQVTSCSDGMEAIKYYNENPYPMVISDIRMPDLSGVDVLSHIKNSSQGKLTDVVLITGYGSMESAIQALRAGAYDYLLKPIDIEELATVVERVEEHISLLTENIEYKYHFDQKVDEATYIIKERCKEIQMAYSQMVGHGRVGIFSEKMQEIKILTGKLHKDRAVPVLIEGETGTGKEVIAQLIHYGSGGVAGPFISINCTAIPPTLFETELFGYEEGAFTDARKKGAMGKFELAQGGTIFLDEIGDLPFDIQPKLLRILEERAFYRVGGVKKIQLDIRVICATNQDLTEKIKEGLFRQDLFYRLNVGRVFAPPLRERREEIVPLAQMFLEKLARDKKKRFSRISPESQEVLENHSWGGNVRELQNTMERVVLLYDDFEVKPQHLSFLGASPEKPPVKTEKLVLADFKLPPGRFDIKEFETEIVQKALERFKGNKTQTAAYLGLTRSALRSKLKE